MPAWGGELQLTCGRRRGSEVPGAAVWRWRGWRAEVGVGSRTQDVGSDRQCSGCSGELSCAQAQFCGRIVWLSAGWQSAGGLLAEAVEGRVPFSLQQAMGSAELGSLDVQTERGSSGQMWH